MCRKYGYEARSNNNKKYCFLLFRIYYRYIEDYIFKGREIYVGKLIN